MVAFFYIFIGVEKYVNFGAICSIQNGSGISYATPPNGDWVTVKTRLNQNAIAFRVPYAGDQYFESALN